MKKLTFKNNEMQSVVEKVGQDRARGYKPAKRKTLVLRKGPSKNKNNEDINNSTTKMDTYTVMADCGVGEFLWRRDSADVDGGVGSNCGSLFNESYVPPGISAALYSEFFAWARWYMKAMPGYGHEGWLIDWDAFNQEGIRLAHRLKDELGDSAQVQYIHAFYDPDRDKDPIAINYPGGP